MSGHNLFNEANNAVMLMSVIVIGDGVGDVDP